MQIMCVMHIRASHLGVHESKFPITYLQYTYYANLHELNQHYFPGMTYDILTMMLIVCIDMQLQGRKLINFLPCSCSGLQNKFGVIIGMLL